MIQTLPSPWGNPTLDPSRRGTRARIGLDVDVTDCKVRQKVSLTYSQFSSGRILLTPICRALAPHTTPCSISSPCSQPIETLIGHSSRT